MESLSMNGRHSLRSGYLRTSLWAALVAALLSSCGGGTGTDRDSGTNKTYLSVQATDPDGDALQYQWRVTGGTVENRNASQTVWTMPDGPGLHFAYVSVTDGKGGYAEQQYVVATDTLGTTAPVRAPLSHTPPAVTDFVGSAGRLRFASTDNTMFTPAAGGAAALRTVYLTDMSVQVVQQSSGEMVFSGLTDFSGEVSLPKLRNGETYVVSCATSPNATLSSCGTFTASTDASVHNLNAPLNAGRNLRLYGHVGFADGGTCGVHNEFFELQSAATVQLQQADGTPLSAALRVNRFGDYALDAAVPIQASLKLQLRCDGYSQLLDVPADAAGYAAARPIELSHQLANSRPQIVKMVANGPEGSVRGRMVVPEAGVVSNVLPGSEQFLTFKGRDSRLSACMYYRALGAVKDCDAQGNMIEPITLEDWKRQNKFAPYAEGNAQVAANYINKMDLNLVRRMTATQAGPQNIAFYVCNHPGPEGQSQEEVDEVMAIALSDQKQVACVAMEWTPTPGVNGDQPFTKFFTFAPDGSLLASINLDTRGEKYLPGACVACHGGNQYNGRFPEKGNPSAYLGASFLPFDTNNYYFASDPALSEAAQSDSLHGLNQLVLATETSATTAVSQLIQGWYAGGGTTLNKNYVPPAWQAADGQPATAGAAHFYHEVIGASCRTCHAAMGPTFNWDNIVLTPVRAKTHVCGGTADILLNASMPNALISRDRVEQRVKADPALAALMTTFLGCDAPLPDPVYPRR